MSADRNMEIWATRLQRELLALTATNNSEASSGDSSQEDVPAVLPSFISVHNHGMNIESGDFAIDFLITLPGTEADTVPIVVTLDCSLFKKSDGRVDPIAVSYPFMKPFAALSSGASRFPAGSTVKDGDLIDVELDWTPSLHLADAILNLALKIKECIAQGEPFHPAVTQPGNDAVAHMVGRARKLGSSLSKGIRSLGSTPERKQGESPAKKGLRALGRNRNKTAMSPKSSSGEIRIGDEINMLEAPWVDCQGVYSCKAIRRSAFVEEAMSLAAQANNKNDSSPSKTTEKPQQMSPTGDDGTVPDELSEFLQAQAGGIKKAANAGLAGAGAMFRNLTQSARSVLEESFLMITEHHIIEMRSNKLNLSTGTITFAIPIDMLAKLKFRRQESISLFFKPAPDDPLIYMCPDSADCVHQIQSVLKRHGVKGKHTNAATHRAINQALHLVQDIQTKELAMKHDPTIERVNEIMDLYRQAAERFEVAGDVRHEEVVTHMRKFLALPLTVSILEGTYQMGDGDAPIANQEGEGVILESSEDIDENVIRSRQSNDEDRAFEESMESILREAEADLANMQVDDNDAELDAMYDEDGNEGEDGDPIADFENMLKEADSEFAKLMAS